MSVATHLARDKRRECDEEAKRDLFLGNEAFEVGDEELVLDGVVGGKRDGGRGGGGGGGGGGGDWECVNWARGEKGMGSQMVNVPETRRGASSSSSSSSSKGPATWRLLSVGEGGAEFGTGECGG